MDIAILHDFVQSEHPGGADLTLKRLMETAPKQIEISWLRVSNALQWNYRQHLVVANTRSMPNVELEGLLEGKKYVKLHFDYGYVSLKIIREAKLLIYMSPKHRDDNLGRFAELSTHVMPSLVNPDEFYPGDKPGTGYIWIGGYSRQKGIRNLWEYAENNEIHIDCYGHGTPRIYLELSEYCHIKDPVPYEEMPELLRQYRTLIHLPKGHEAGSRIFIEAVLSGLQIRTNQFEGDLSYDEPYNKTKWEKRLREGPGAFWEAAIKALQN